MYQCIFNVFGTPFLFQFPRGSYLFLEGLTFVGIIWVTCAILEATRATFLEVLYSSVDTPGSGQLRLAWKSSEKQLDICDAKTMKNSILIMNGL